MYLNLRYQIIVSLANLNILFKLFIFIFNHKFNVFLLKANAGRIFFNELFCDLSDFVARKLWVILVADKN